MIAPVFRIFLQRAQPLECLFIGTISDLAEQFVGILLEVQQIIHIHQHFLGLFVFRMLQFLLKGIESVDTVWISFCLSKLLLEFNILFQVFVHGHNLPSIPPEIPNSGLPQHISQSTHSGVLRSLVDDIGAEAIHFHRCFHGLFLGNRSRK